MKARGLHLLIVGVLSVGVAACALIGTEDEDPVTGLAGRVLAGPTCPVERADDPCPDRPFSAWFDVFDGQGRPGARFQSDADGLFEVMLRPGTYTIIPDEAAPIIFPRSQPQTVTVLPGTMTQVTLLFDTGIR